MTDTIEKKGRGTSIAAENCQEVLESGKNASLTGQSQFYTPVEFAVLCAKPLPRERPVIVDLNAGAGNLVMGAANTGTQHGLLLDIENCRTRQIEGRKVDTTRIVGDCTKVYPLAKEIDAQFDLFALNPPWSVHWHRTNLAKLAESEYDTIRRAFKETDSSGPDAIDSTVATMMMALDLMSQRGEGVLIANNSTLERLIFGLDAPYKLLENHCWARVVVKGNPMTGEAKQTFDKEKDFETGVVYFALSHMAGVQCAERPADDADLSRAFEHIAYGRDRFREGLEVVGRYNTNDGQIEAWKAIRAEWEVRQGKRQGDYNIWLATDDTITTYLSVFDGRSVKIDKNEAKSLFSLNGRKCMELVMMRAERQLLLRHVNGGLWRVHPALKEQVEKAIAAYYACRAPLYPLNPIQSLGFVDESETLECSKEMRADDERRIQSPAEKVLIRAKELGVRIKIEPTIGYYEGVKFTTYMLDADLTPEDKVTNDLESDVETLKVELFELLNNKTPQSAMLLFRAGENYKVRTKTVSVSRTVLKPGADGEDHEHWLKGQELAIYITDETGKERCFMDKRHVANKSAIEDDTASGYTAKEISPDFDLETLASHFKIPTAPDVGACQPENYKANLNFLDKLEALIGNGFHFMPFQRRDFSRAALHDGLIMASEPGLGKTLAGIALALLKVGLHPQANGMILPFRPVLIIAPENLHSQMIEDYKCLLGSAMPEVTRLDSQETYLRLSPLKPGWYISSFTQIAMNKVKQIPDIPETPPGDEELAALMKFFGVTVMDAVACTLKNEYGEPADLNKKAMHLCAQRRAWMAAGVGEQKNGIKCVYSPSLADLVRHSFQCVVIDEAVRIKAEDSIVGIGVRSLEPKYRFVLTGTPIKNRLPDIFFLAGWACDSLDEATPRWPYQCNKEGEIDRFAAEFLVQGRDLTKERKEAEGRRGSFQDPRLNRHNSRKKRGKATAEVCNIHRMWKLLAPVVLRRRKKDIGQEIVAKIKKPIYVPMGKQQAQTYKYHLEASYLDRNGGAAIGAKLQALRNAAAAPHTELLISKEPPEREGAAYDSHGERLFRSKQDYIPKLHACLTVIEEILRQREQVVVFSAFHEPLDTLSRYLNQAGVPHDVLDGRMNAGRRGTLAMEFKRGLQGGAKPVLLAGNKAMAEGNSWNLCNNAILFAFDWAYDLFAQAIERVHRLNSKKTVKIWPIICNGTIDKKLESLIDEKGDSAELVLDGQLMHETTEEVSLAKLLNIAYESFNATDAIPEEECFAQWPALCKSLTEAYSNLKTGPVIPEARKQQSAKAEVVTTLRKPAISIFSALQFPQCGNTRIYKFV